ncbi:MAG: hypothetical protein P8Y51_02950 [Campylobacterales bacterium]
MKTLFALITLAASLFAGIPAGNAFPATTLEDQFEKRHSVSAEDRIVLVSFERDVSNAVNAFLQKQPKGFLKVHNAKYIADISAMPTIVSKLFALPKIRRKADGLPAPGRHGRIRRVCRRREGRRSFR